MDKKKLANIVQKAAVSANAESAKRTVQDLGIHPSQFGQIVGREFAHGEMLGLNDAQLGKLASYFPELKSVIKHKRPLAIESMTESDPSLKPPKKWAAKMTKDLKKRYGDKAGEVMGSIWYHQLSPSKKSEIRKREGKHYGKANEAMEKKSIGEWEVSDHGVDNASYWPGVGVSHTQWDEVQTGIGYSAKQAGEDALEQLAMNGYEIPQELEDEIAELSDTDTVSEILNQDKPAEKWIVSHHSRSMGSKIAEEEFESESEAIEYIQNRLAQMNKMGLEVEELEAGEEWEVTEPNDAVMVPDETGIISLKKNDEEIEKWERSVEDHELSHYVSIFVKQEGEGDVDESLVVEANGKSYGLTEGKALKEKDIKYERGNFWVADEGDAYTVYKIGVTHSTSDSSYAHDEDGLSIAKARVDYLSKRFPAIEAKSDVVEANGIVGEGKSEIIAGLQYLRSLLNQGIDPDSGEANDHMKEVLGMSNDDIQSAYEMLADEPSIEEAAQEKVVKSGEYKGKQWKIIQTDSGQIGSAIDYKMVVPGVFSSDYFTSLEPWSLKREMTQMKSFVDADAKPVKEAVEEAQEVKLNSTYQPDHYYVNFEKLPKSEQEKLKLAKVEVENSRYTVGEDMAFIRAQVEVNGKLWDAEISLGSVDIKNSDYKWSDEQDSYVTDEGDALDSDEYAESAAEDLLAVTELENTDVYLTLVGDLEEAKAPKEEARQPFKAVLNSSDTQDPMWVPAPDMEKAKAWLMKQKPGSESDTADVEELDVKTGKILKKHRFKAKAGSWEPIVEAKTKLDDRADELLAAFEKKIGIDKAVADEIGETEIGDDSWRFGGREVSVSTPDGLTFIWDVNSYGDRHSYMLFDIVDENGKSVEESLKDLPMGKRFPRAKKSLSKEDEEKLSALYKQRDAMGVRNGSPEYNKLQSQIDAILGESDLTEASKLNIGDKVKISHGSGTLSDKSGIIVDPKEVKTDGKSIPTNIQGAYAPVDWSKEVAIKLDSGELVTMFKNRVIPIQAEVSEAMTGDSPGIYVGTYGKYASGSIEGKWLNPADYEDKEAFLEAARELHKDESDPELMFQDYQGFPERYYSESSVPEELWDWLGLDEEEQAVLEAYMEATGDKKATIKDARDHFLGKAESVKDYAYDLVDQMGGLKELDEQTLNNYLYVTDTDIRILVADEVSSRMGDLSEEEILEQGDLADEHAAAVEAGNADEAAKILAQATSVVEDSIAVDLEKKLRDDAIGYFVDELGMDIKDLADGSLFSFDYEKYARDLEMSGDMSFVRHEGEIYAFSA